MVRSAASLFLMKLADYGVDTFDLSEEVLDRDVASARRHRKVLELADEAR